MNPYFLPEHSVVSFSGGRTSGYMLRQILDAFGGTLPPWVKVVFTNTGKEREETLDFIQECSQCWKVPITWLEYIATPSGKHRKKDGKELWRHTFKVVNHTTASRKGEPFDMAIRMRAFLPNPVMRFCTGELKIKTTNRWVRQVLGWVEYTNAIGFRFDEPDRVANLIYQEKVQPVDTQLLMFDDLDEEEEEGAWRKKVPGETGICPLFDAQVTRDDVMEFWSHQEFDLRLKPHEGNCDGCFLKGAQKLIKTFSDRPDLADWWIDWEKRIPVEGRCRTTGTAVFRSDRPGYRELKMIATGQPLPGEFDFGPVDLSLDGKGCALWDDCRCTD